MFGRLSVIALVLLSCCMSVKAFAIEADLSNHVQPDDIVVTNQANDSILLLNSDGEYKSVLVDIPTSPNISFNALAFDHFNKQLLFTHDSVIASDDAVKSISLEDGAVRNYVSNSSLAGVLAGLVRLKNGDLLVLESANTLERFNIQGSRVGSPYMNSLISYAMDVNQLQSGGFVACSSSTANTVRTYNENGIILATATSAYPSPSIGALGATSCIQKNDGTIIVAYSGSTDAVRAYDSALGKTLWTFTDANTLLFPGKLAVRSNGNILVTDTILHHIVEIDSHGVLVRTIGGAVLSGPTSIVVIP